MFDVFGKAIASRASRSFPHCVVFWYGFLAVVFVTRVGMFLAPMSEICNNSRFSADCPGCCFSCRRRIVALTVSCLIFSTEAMPSDSFAESGDVLGNHPPEDQVSNRMDCAFALWHGEEDLQAARGDLGIVEPAPSLTKHLTKFFDLGEEKIGQGSRRPEIQEERLEREGLAGPSAQGELQYGFPIILSSIHMFHRVFLTTMCQEPA